MPVDLTDIRTLRVTDKSLEQYLEGNYPAFLEFYMSFLKSALDQGEVSSEQVALEILSKLFLHKAPKISIEDTIELLPREWQGELVPVPLPVLEALMPRYIEYSQTPENSTIGQAWGLEGKGTTGKRRSARNLKALRTDMFLALEIEQLYHLEKFQGKGVTTESLIQECAARRGMSESRARKAHGRFKSVARGYLNSLRLFKDS
jgi:hypothetical protein